MYLLKQNKIAFVFRIILVFLLFSNVCFVQAQSRKRVKSQLAEAIEAAKKRCKTESDTIDYIIKIMKDLEAKTDSISTSRNSSSSLERMKKDMDSLQNMLYAYQIYTVQYRSALDLQGNTKKVTKADLKKRWKAIQKNDITNRENGEKIKAEARKALEIYNRNLEESKLISIRTYFETGRHILEQSERNTLLSWFNREVRSQIDLSDENETKLLEFEISGYADGQTYRTNDESKTNELTTDRALFTARYLKSIIDVELVGNYTINYYDNEQPFNDDQQADYIKQRVEELIIKDVGNTTNKLYIIFTYRGLSRAIPPNVVPNGREDDINRRISVVQVIRHYRPIID